MGGKAAGIAAGAVVCLVIAIITVVGGGGVASADPPDGGCAIQAGAPQGGRGGGPGPAGPGTKSANQKSATLDANQMSVARTIIGVGKGMKIAERGTAIALATAMQESQLHPDAVSGRSVGLFQQQGSLYASVRRTDPADATRAFYTMLLQRVPNYADPASGTLADVAQRVQASGAGPMYYAQWENWATTLAHQLYQGTAATGGNNGDAKCKVGGGSGPIKVSVHGLVVDLPPQAGVRGSVRFPSPQAATAGAAALSYLGTTYAWGGGTAKGPSRGIRDGGVADEHGDYAKIGFDCSGLMLYAYATAGITLPRTAAAQQQVGHQVPYGAAQPGDLLFYGVTAHHVSMYLGKVAGQDLQIEAPDSGDVVKVSRVRVDDQDFTNTAVQPW